MALFLWLGMVAGAKAEWADDFFGAKPDDFVKSRSYIGGMGISSTIDQWGDFNGINSLQFGPTTIVSGGVSTFTIPEVDYIPAITRNFGWGVLLGHREGPWALETSYWRSEHTANYYSASATLTSPAALQSINFDFKRYFFTQVPTQPFVSVGLSVPWLWIRQFSYLLGSPVQVNDLTISGVGLNLGAGLEIYLGDGFSVTGGALRRWTAFDQVNGATKIPLTGIYFDGNPKDLGSLAGDGYQFYVGTTFGVE
jgi:hypothetical protein